MSPFQRLVLCGNPDGSTTVHWLMNPGQAPTTTVEFYIDKARSGGGWTEIGGPVTNACVFVDNVRWNWNYDTNTFYRVRYLKGADWIMSDPSQSLNGQWTHDDWRRAHEILRKEYLRMRVGGGYTGKLLKMKEWGVPCPRCADFDTKEAADGQCEICFGTSLEGGYYSPIPMPVDFQPMPDAGRKLGEGGLAQGISKTGRYVAFPFVMTGDLWVPDCVDERWTIGEQLKIEAEIKGVPLIKSAVFTLEPKTSVVYKAGMTDKIEEYPVAVDSTDYTWYDKMRCLNY